ncbi:hypothetical protein N7452_008397 [Penicillium brevicompactum]|uniref:Chromo domain-containing protein n=1 Tax=Penicillium brevicompactum TaxID=5074 RepID=A0A9W9U927_PENBR|nr:hypothetical protein N7452_008397 [Penicillium brevicompactum]
MPPPVEDVSEEESGDIPFRDAPEDLDDKQKDGDNKDSDEEDDDDDEENYVVEKIVRHDWLDDGTLKLFVKWQGYDAIKDHTWEEEENLMEGASEILTQYYAKIGGRPERPTTEKPKPGRKRKSMGESSSKPATPNETPVPAAKRGRKSAATKELEKVADKAKENSVQVVDDDGNWLPKGKWDKELKEVSTIMRGEKDEGLFAYLLFNNGKTARVSVRACYEKCPKKMLEFYESHLVFKGEGDE